MISVITPLPESHMPFVNDAYTSLVNQTHKDWEWIVGRNAGGMVEPSICRDGRVRPILLEDESDGKNRVGRLKRECCMAARGDILVELDADDMLTPNALEMIEATFRDPAVVMTYSNCAEFQHGTWTPRVYSEYWGWRSRLFEWHGKLLQQMIAWPSSPASFRRIEWAPNHVRAWRRDAYFGIGGHDASMRFGDDHDLCCRMAVSYGFGAIRHIDECLYLYRLHGNNNCVVKNDEVQAQVWLNQLKYSEPMAERWARDCGLRLLDLGGRFNPRDGYEEVDLHGGDIEADLNLEWPFESSSVGVIRASHIFEHLRDPVHVMNEAYRVLAPGGWLFIDVPSTDGRGAFQDPTHVSYWNINSFWYYTNRLWSRFIEPRYIGRFQVSRVTQYFPDEFHLEHDIPCVRADLLALKHPYDIRPVGEVLI